MVLFEEENEAKNAHTRQEHFLAMIAFQVYLIRISILGTNGEPVMGYNDFMLKFKDAEEIEKYMEDEDFSDQKSEEIERRKKASKQAWLSFVGKGKGSKTPPQKTKGTVPQKPKPNHTPRAKKPPKPE